jgi:hypothetical protein
MKIKLAFAAVAALALAVPTGAVAQNSGRGIVSLYHAAPGHQVMLLQWLAEQDRIAAAAGLPGGQLYAHTDGDSWDYLVVFPQTTPAQDEALDAAAKKLGLAYGPRVGIELRKHITSHTDTLVRGPMTAREYLTMIGEK